MDLPPVTDEEKSIVKQALVGAGVTEEALSAFDDNVLERLYRGGYKSNIKLNTAQRPGLVDCGLLPADVDFLLTQLAPPGHLIPSRLPAVARAMGVHDSNSPRNGLLWCDFIEAAFECWDICFSFGLVPQTLKLHVVNKNLASMKLVELAQCKGKGYVDMLGDRNFGSLNNSIVTITNRTNAFPLRRAIAWHAAPAIDMARTKGLLPDGFKEEALDLKVTSEFDEVEAVEAWACMCLTAGPPEEVGTIAEDEDEGLSCSCRPKEEGFEEEEQECSCGSRLGG